MNKENNRLRIFQWLQSLRWLRLLVLASLCGLSGNALAEKRVALVVGNNDYEQARLRNPVNDAVAIGAKLEAMGYETTVLKNDKRLELEAALDRYSEQVADADFALFYYAGHAIQVDGRNYLIPIDAKLAARRDIKKLIQLGDVTDEVGQADSLGVVILDACRDNPFNAALDESLGRGLVGRGLSGSIVMGGNTLIAYATEEDAVAADGHGKHSPYTQALLEHISTPSVDVRLMFGKVRDAVIKNTGGRQRPFVYGSLGGTSYFLNSKEAAPPKVVTQQPIVTSDIGRPRSISNSDMSRVMDMFSDLHSAIKRKDRDMIHKLTTPSEDRDKYIDYLFENFSTIDVSLSRVRAVDEKSSIVGLITIDRLVRSNGDIGIPAKSHRTISIESKLVDDDWTQVIW